MHVGDLHTVGWGEAPGALVAPLKAIGVGDGIIKEHQNVFKTAFSVLQNSPTVEVAYDYLQLEPIGLVFVVFFAVVLGIQVDSTLNLQVLKYTYKL